MNKTKRKKLEKAGWKVGTAKQFLRSGSKILRGRHLSPDEIHEITKAIATCNDPRQLKYLIKFAENRQKALANKPKKPRVKRKGPGDYKVVIDKEEKFEHGKLTSMRFVPPGAKYYNRSMYGKAA